MLIQYYRYKCIGCGACAEVAPERWRMSTKDGKCTLVGGQLKKNIYQAKVHDIEADENKEAAQNCPVKAIRV